MSIEPGRRRNLSAGHVAGIALVGTVGGVIALILFLTIVGFLFRIVEIVVVVLIVGLLVRWLVGRALR